jgi:hypothetical protein
LAKKEKSKENAAPTTGSDLDSEAPAESGMEDDPIPSDKPHVEFCPPVVVDVSKDAPLAVKVFNFIDINSFQQSVYSQWQKTVLL